jgi:hypothetical protein
MLIVIILVFIALIMIIIIFYLVHVCRVRLGEIVWLANCFRALQSLLLQTQAGFREWLPYVVSDFMGTGLVTGSCEM